MEELDWQGKGAWGTGMQAKERVVRESQGTM
jgi:hypothetical protein